MSKPNPQSITVEEAVALMINMDDVSTDCSLFEILEAVCDDAEESLEKSRADGCTEDEEKLLKLRLESSYSRHMLAQRFFDNLKCEIKNPQFSEIKLADDSTQDEPRMTFESLRYWAAYMFGLKLPIQKVKTPPKEKPSWRDVKIILYEDFELDCWIANKKIESTYEKIGLMGKRRRKPSQDGLILWGILAGEKYPSGASRKTTGSERVAMNRIRDALKGMTGLHSPDPFTYNPVDGYKPVFKYKLEPYSKLSEGSSGPKIQTISYDDNDDYRYK